MTWSLKVILFIIVANILSMLIGAILGNFWSAALNGFVTFMLIKEIEWGWVR